MKFQCESSFVIVNNLSFHYNLSYVYVIQVFKPYMTHDNTFLPRYLALGKTINMILKYRNVSLLEGKTCNLIILANFNLKP